MRTFQCPKCHLKVTCLGEVEGHKCPSNMSKWVPGSKWNQVGGPKLTLSPKVRAKLLAGETRWVPPAKPVRA